MKLVFPALALLMSAGETPIATPVPGLVELTVSVKTVLKWAFEHAVVNKHRLAVRPIPTKHTNFFKAYSDLLELVCWN